MLYQTILLADDEPTVRDCVCRFLNSFGYSVLPAGDGVEALDKAHQHDGDICLLVADILMPRMNGIELARHFHDARPSAKILLISGTPNAFQAQTEVKTDFLSKPFTKDELREKIEALLAA